MTDKQRIGRNLKRYLKAEMVKRGISGEDLAELLSRNGNEYSRSSIYSKMSRGTFSATFFVQSLLAMGCDNVNINDIVSNEK